MKAQNKDDKVRRSVAVPQALADEALAVAPDGPRKNFNRVVVLALTEYIASRKRQAFAATMEMMAADADVAAESIAVYRGLTHTETDGLPDA